MAKLFSVFSTFLLSIYLVTPIYIYAQDDGIFSSYRGAPPYGRTQEVEDILQALLRVRKGHVLLTGKIGTDFQPILEEIKGAFSSYMLEQKNARIIRMDINPDQLNSHMGNPLQNYVNNAKEGRMSLLLIVNNAQGLSQRALRQIQAEIQKPFGMGPHDTPLKLVLVTDSANGRKLTVDSGFASLFTPINLHELSPEEIVKAIEQNINRIWKKAHPLYEGFTDKALEYAFNYSHLEQAGITTYGAIRELIEGAIILKSRQANTPFTLTTQDVRAYIKGKAKLDLLPGASDFDQNFQKMWGQFGNKYGGNEGVKYQIKEKLFNFFSRTNKRKMESWILHGAPGAGKSYLAEVLSKVYFKGALLEISGSELSKKSDLSKLIGSPPGYVGSEEQRSLLTQFISENPHGGVILIEEADYMSQDIVQFLTNMKSSQKFKDGLGKTWSTSPYIIIQNTNIGQDIIIPPNAKNAMTWEQYHMRLAQATNLIEVDGKKIPIVKEKIMNQMQEDYIRQIVMSSNPNGESSLVAQEANKQKRRDTNIFIMSPSEEDLLSVAKIKIKELKQELLLDNEIKLTLSHQALEKILQIEHYNFFKGYSYVEEQIEKNLITMISALNFRARDEVRVSVSEGQIKVYQNEILKNEKTLKMPIDHNVNPWRSSEKMRDNIKNLARNMSKHLKGSQAEIETTKAVLEKSLVDYNGRKVFTLLGTTGNGKTQYAKSLAMALYGSKEAMFPITNLNSPGDLNSYLRPAAGYMGSNKETDFEQWFKARQKAGGGVILFDELLSYAGLNGEQLSNKIAVFNELYSLLDEGKIKIAGKIEDASSFIIVLTGNSFQEDFMNLPAGPDGERQAEKIAKSITHDDMIQYFSKRGLDAPKVARMGHIFVKGPLPQKIAKQIVRLQATSQLQKLLQSSGYKTKLDLDPKLLTVLSEKLPTSSLGFRNVEQGIEKALTSPITSILANMKDVKKIKASLEGKHIKWFVNNKEVLFIAQENPEFEIRETSWVYQENLPKNYENITPNLESILPKLKKNEALNVKIVSIHELEGHWLMDFLLSGKNTADFVSMIPGSQALGYVRPRPTPSTMNLSPIIKRLMVLEAGHRSVIYRGIHALGGGTAKRDPNQMPSDDLGRIDRLLDALINNKIFPSYSELHSQEKKQFFKLTMSELIQEMTDYLIAKGDRLNVAKPLIDKLIKDTYLTGEYLDEYVTSFIKNSPIDPQKEMMEALEFAMDKITKKEGFLTRVRNAVSKTEKKKLLEDIQKKITEDLKNAKRHCPNLYL